MCKRDCRQSCQFGAFSLALKEFSCFDFELDRVTTILEQGLRSGSPS